MKRLKILGLAAITLSAFTFGSCNVEDDNLFKTGTITHGGIDWSVNASVPSEYTNADGETIGWCSIGSTQQGVTGIWYRSNTSGELMYNLGNVELSSVEAFNANLADTDICDSPMAVGDVWVTDCKDGYVKFKVKTVDDVNNSPNGDWAVGVEYEFSTSTTFE